MKFMNIAEDQRNPIAYRFGTFILNPIRRQLLHNGQVVKLTPRAIDLLTFLVMNAPRHFNTYELMERVWHGYQGDSNNVAQQIRRIRQALGPEAAQYVRSHDGGYMFAAQVEALSAAEESATEHYSNEDSAATDSSAEPEAAAIGRLAARQHVLRLEFIRQAETFGIDPRPVPHVHFPHQEIAVACRLAAVAAHVVGIGTATFIAAAAFNGFSTTAVLLTLLAYGLVASTLNMAVFVFWPAEVFIRRLKRLMIGPALVGIISMGAVMVQRFATAQTASLLLAVDPYIWLSLEFASLTLGVLAFAGYRRYAWSAQLTRACHRIDGETHKLKVLKGRRPVQPPALDGV
jgi:DNA-binding winged helix-turn-helix (wHTH) protein